MAPITTKLAKDMRGSPKICAAVFHHSAGEFGQQINTIKNIYIYIALENERRQVGNVERKAQNTKYSSSTTPESALISLRLWFVTVSNALGFLVAVAVESAALHSL